MTVAISQTAADLVARLESHESRIGIVGLGYVGIPLALRFHEVGLTVLGFDIDRERVAVLNAGETPIKHISPAEIAEMRSKGFEATDDFSRITEVDAIIVCVPTPLNRHREPDLSFILNTMNTITPYLRTGQVLSLESTTWPGTTEEVLKPFVESRGFVVGDDFFLIYSPEREDPGNPNFSTRTIPKVVGGISPVCAMVAEALYSAVIDRVVPVSSTQTAELTKLLENIHRSVNIGLVNEIKIIADRMGIDVYEVIDAAATKPFGFTAYYPGPGLGGHCIPIDPFYLTWKAREYGINTRFIELAGEVNRGIPDYVVSKVSFALNRVKRSVNGAKVLVLGISYKRDVDDMRESPSVVLMEKLRELNADVAYSDPYIPVFPKSEEHDFDLTSVALTPESLASFDVVLMATDHAAFDYEMIAEHAPIIVDTRGKFRTTGDKVVAA